MDEQPNLHEFLNEVSSFAGETTTPVAVPQSAPVDAVGKVVEIAGSGSLIRMNAAVPRPSWSRLP